MKPIDELSPDTATQWNVIHLGILQKKKKYIKINNFEKKNTIPIYFQRNLNT